MGAGYNHRCRGIKTWRNHFLVAHHGNAVDPDVPGPILALGERQGEPPLVAVLALVHLKYVGMGVVGANRRRDRAGDDQGLARLRAPAPAQVDPIGRGRPAWREAPTGRGRTKTTRRARQ